MTKEKHHEAHPAKPKPKAKKEPAHEKPHAEEQPYYEEPPEDHPPPPLPTGQEPQAPGTQLQAEQKAGHDAVAKAEQGAHNKPPPHEEGT